MTRLIFMLLTLLILLSGSAMGVNSDFGHCALAAKGAPEMVTMYRAVSQAELQSVRAVTYGSSPSMGGKYFALTQEGAQNFATGAINAGERMTITSTQVPRSVVNQGFHFNDVGAQGAGASVHFQQDFLQSLYNAMSPIKIH